MTDSELNDAVAKKLGFRHMTDDPIEGAPTNMVFSPTPDYCHSIEAAWEIAEHLKKTLSPFYRIVLTYHHQIANGGWMFEIQDSGTYMPDGINQLKECALANTAPRAICEAFLELP